MKSKLPIIHGAGGGKGAREPTIAPNSLFSTDVLFVTLALGEGPIYRINPNGPQDVEIQDSDVTDLVNFDNNSVNPEKFFYVGATGTTSQKPLPYFGDEIVTPQTFASPVALKKGNIAGVPANKVLLQETSSNDWDSIRFNFLIDALAYGTSTGDVYPYSISVKIDIFDSLQKLITSETRKIEGKSDTSLKMSVQIAIPENDISSNGYLFTITKESDDVDDSRIFDDIKIVGWDEIKNEKLAYPRTALIGLALKAVNEHQGGVPNFTNLIKGMLVKVPSNYNQPTLANSEIDWRHLEIAESGDQGYTTTGYYLQFSGTEVKYDANPNIYKGVWDGTFVYSWTQNPVWIMYDILTNNVYGLGIPEKNIDKYTFYKLAMYCDACDFSTGNFIGVDGLADGSFRNKPLGQYVSNIENQLGLPKGTAVKERRFVCDISITDQSKGIDTLNELAAAIRSILIYSGGKVSIASDMPDEYPAMIFNEKNIKSGSISVSGYKLSDVLTAVDASYIDPTNHFKREVVHVDANEVNNGINLSETENTLSIDLKGVTRRSQAMRSAQYLLAGSRYQKRSISFSTGTDALYLSPGDLISVSTTTSGLNYGYGGRVFSNSAISDSGNTYVFLEHFTTPVISDSIITANSYPLALRITKQDTDRTDLYVVSNSDFVTSNVYGATNDHIQLKALQKYDPINKTFGASISSFDANNAPVVGDLWSFGEIENPLNFYTSKAGRLFKVKEIKRDEDEQVSISAVEYIPEIYTDSDSFINYEPISYVDTVNYFEIPPIPKLSFSKKPRKRIDGSIAIDARMTTSTPTDKFYTDFATEYEIASPETYALLNNVADTTPTTIYFDENSAFADNKSVIIEGKNGFSTPVGSIPLLCTAISTANLGYVTLTVRGLNAVIDENFGSHVLEINDGFFSGVPKGADAVTVPVNEKTTEASQLNFVGYADKKRLVSRTLTGYDLDNDKLIIEDTVAGTSKLSQKLPNPPFYVNISQVLEADNYENNSFYIEGYRDTYITEGSLDTDTIDLPVVPRAKAFTRLYIDGIKKTSYTLNQNQGIGAANIQYSGSGEEYRAEIDYYAPPIIEVGDLIEDDFSNTYTVVSCSYDTNHPDYNAALTVNSIFRIETLESPREQLTGQRFTNITVNPSGILTNVTANSASLSYSKSDYPGLLNLANDRIYHLSVNSNFESFVPDSDSVIKDLPLGTTTIRARNRNLLGRTSRYSQKSITVTPLPIQKVQNLTVIETLYREQLGGVSTRVTVEFDHIQGQEVTDYEISYKIASEEDVAGITAFNTVKTPAVGVDIDNKIRFTINNVDRGPAADSNSITVRVTPLNKDIRGKTATFTKQIKGKEVEPDNVFNFVGGQQTDQITLLWSYPRAGDQLKDLDLKEVVIRRIAGEQPINDETYAAAIDLVTVSAGTARKSIPIDYYGTFTYLARTRDTSDKLSTTVTGTVITTVKPQHSTVIKAYSEDDPGTRFSELITNSNSDEYYYPSTNSNTGGLAYNSSDSAFDSSLVDNANGSSSGWSAVAGQDTDLIAGADAEYVTQIRDVGGVVTASVLVDLEANQVLQSTYNDQKDIRIPGVSDSSMIVGNTYVAGSIGAQPYTGSDVAMSAIVQFPDTPADGCLYECGGAGIGSYLGLRDSGTVLRLRYGSGASAVSNSDTTTTVLDVTDFPTDNNHHHISWDFNTSNGDARLWIDNELKGVGTRIGGSGGSWSGGDAGGYGQITSSVMTGEPSAAWPGDIDNNLNIYYQQLLFDSVSYANVLIDADFGGIGHVLGYANAAVPSGRYDSNNRTWMTGGASGNVWAIWSPDSAGEANANSYALIAGLINSTAIALGETFYANGDPTGSNALANVTSTPSSYQLVNLIQYNDDATLTYQGDLGAVSTQTFIRTSSADSVYYANGNVDITTFDNYQANDGWSTYEAGSKTFKSFQLRYNVRIKEEEADNYDLYLDKFRYTVNKEQTITSNTVPYAASPTVVDYVSSNFLNTPVVSFSVLDQIDAEANPAIVVTTALSNQSVSFKLFASDGSGEYNANSSANVMVTVVGV